MEQSLTREQLAGLSGVNASAIKRAERFGKLSLAQFSALAAALGLDDEVRGFLLRRLKQTPPLVFSARFSGRVRGSTRRRRRLGYPVAPEL